MDFVGVVFSTKKLSNFFAFVLGFLISKKFRDFSFSSETLEVELGYSLCKLLYSCFLESKRAEQITKCTKTCVAKIEFPSEDSALNSKAKKVSGAEDLCIQVKFFQDASEAFCGAKFTRVFGGPIEFGEIIEKIRKINKEPPK